MGTNQPSRKRAVLYPSQLGFGGMGLGVYLMDRNEVERGKVVPREPVTEELLNDVEECGIDIDVEVRADCFMIVHRIDNSNLGRHITLLSALR